MRSFAKGITDLAATSVARLASRAGRRRLERLFPDSSWQGPVLEGLVLAGAHPGEKVTRKGILLGLVMLGLVMLAALSTGCVPRKADVDRKQEGSSRTSSHEPSKAGAKKPRSSAVGSPEQDPLLTEPFRDDFERASLGADWRVASPAWKLEGGQLCVAEARNQPAWLARRLPLNATIQFSAVSHSNDGDIKAEAWGDGISGAEGVSYDHATSYVAIFGGWKNRFHVLARLDEHADDRSELELVSASSDARLQRVKRGRSYRFHIERRDGKTVRWLVDEVELFALVDNDPLQGAGHDHFGFNDWSSKLCFDDLAIVPLPS
jgi:hypothetical protein